MILIQYTKFSDVVDKKKWFYHRWVPPFLKERCYPSRLEMQLCNSERFGWVDAFRFFGVEVTVFWTTG